MKQKHLIPRALLCFMIALAMMIFTACGEPEKAENNDTEAPTAAETEAPTEAPTEAIELTEGVAPNSITGDEENGFYYVGADGTIDYGYCDGVNIDGADWVVCEGRAYRVYTEAGATWYRAAQAVAACTQTSMTREEKLRAAFDYIKTAYLEGVLHDPPYQEMDWPIVCANDLFIYGKGDCFSYGAAYSYMAKAIGYEEVYACNSGGHGWAEIEGKFYDPEWDMHHSEYNHFGVSPEDKCDVNYAKSLMDGVEWMRVLI